MSRTDYLVPTKNALKNTINREKGIQYTLWKDSKQIPIKAYNTYFIDSKISLKVRRVGEGP